MNLSAGVYEGERFIPCPKCGSHRVLMMVLDDEMVWQCECGSSDIGDGS